MDGNSGNSFVGGGGSNWGKVPNKNTEPNSGGELFYIPGGSFNGGLGGTSGGGIGLGPAFTPSTWTLSSNGTLTYSVAALTVSPAPELGEWLLMLLGFGLVGFYATLRKQKIAFA